MLYLIYTPAADNLIVSRISMQKFITNNNSGSHSSTLYSVLGQVVTRARNNHIRPVIELKALK